MERMSWPHLYRVTLRGIEGQIRVETVLSWQGGHKAVAVAVEVHMGGWWAPEKTWPVYSVDVEDQGLAPTNPDGTVGQGPPGYLEDRAEF
jgi:hypothetical protein